jgi:site-specific recombinase XerD
MSKDEKLYLTKRKSSGTWYIGFFVQGKLHWRTTRCETKSEALEFLKTFSPTIEQPKKELLLSQMFETFVQLHGSSLRSTTLRGYREAVEEFIRVLGDKLITLYNSQDVELFKQTLVSRNLTPSSVNVRYRSVKSIFGYALRHEFIMKSPFAKTSQVKMAQRTPLFLSKEDLNTLLEKITSPVLRDLFLFGALTGMRLSEICNLKWTSIEWEQNQIVVKNDEDFTTKSGRERVVPIHPLVLDALQRQHARNKNSEFVFSKNTYRYSESYISHQFKHFVGEAKLDSRLHFHSLRHTMASLLIAADVSIFEVQKLLGHSSVGTTMIYSHLSKSKLEQSVSKVQL